MGLSSWLSSKESACQHRSYKRRGFHPWVRKIPWRRDWCCPEGNWSCPLQYSCLENPMDRGAWWSAVHRVTKSWTQLKRLSMHEAEIVTLTSLVLCITSEPLGRCPSISRTPECPGQVKHSRRVWAPWSLLRGSRSFSGGLSGESLPASPLYTLCLYLHGPWVLASLA